MTNCYEVVDRVERIVVRHKARLAQVFVGAVVVIWMSGMTAGFTAAACRKDSIEPEKRAVYCSISLAAGVFFDVIPIDHRGRSLVQLNRGIAYLQAGRVEDARADFDQAIGILIRHLDKDDIRDPHMRIIATHPDPRVEPFWRARMDEMSAGGR